MRSRDPWGGLFSLPGFGVGPPGINPRSTKVITMPRVTVLLPIRNGGRFLERAVASIQAQTFRDFELLVMDDASTDDTQSILERMAASDRRLRVVRLSPSGLVGALNHGLALANSPYLARMDGDDIATPKRLEYQVACLDQRPEVIVCGGDQLHFGAQWRYVRAPRSDSSCKAALLLFPCFAHPVAFFRLEVLLRTNIRYREEYPLAEDYKLWSELAPFGAFANVPHILLYYRHHAGQTSAVWADRQRSLHCQISVANFRRLGIADVTEQDIHQFLWRSSADASLERADYIGHAMWLIKRIRQLDLDTEWLVRAMLLRLGSNLR